MTRKSFIVFLFLFITYTFFVSKFAPTWWHGAQHTWQENIIKAQDYLYNNGPQFTNVIIGSSLSSRMIIDSLPNSYNLSFGGYGIFEGLNLLNFKTEVPTNVFIEMNVILRNENKGFISSVTSPVMFNLRKYLPSLREDRQPISVFGENLIKSLKKLKSVISPKMKTEIRGNVPESKSPLFSKLLKLQIEDYSQTPSKKVLHKVFLELKKHISELRQRNVKVIFFEMPVNPGLENLPKAKIIRESFYRYFPINDYQYISLPKNLAFETTDGLHLNEIEAMQYTLYFKYEMKTIYPR